MKIFDKRPLSLILCMLLGGFVFFSVSGEAWRIALLSIGTLILAFAIFVPLKEFKGRILTVICAVSILFGSTLSFLYFDLYFTIGDRYEGEVELTGVVMDSDSFSYGRNLTIKAETINEEKGRGRTVVAFATLEESENISVGSRIKLKGIISDFTDELDEDSASYYRASGHSAVVTEIKNMEYVEYAGDSLKNKIDGYRDALCRRIIAYSDEESGGLLCALLLGERTYLASETRHDFSRCGMSHVLALSGMHLAILSFAIELLLSKLGVMKKPRKVIQIILVLLYMALTGFPASVMRAGIMLILSSLLFLLSHRADSVTSLFMSVAVILVAEPYAAFDIALWLSAFATLGILVFLEFYEEEKGKVRKISLRHRIFNLLAVPLLISVFAFGATFFLSASSFKSFSLLSPITTALYSIVIEVYMYLGVLFLICGRFLSLGSIVKPFGALITQSVRSVSSISGIYVSAEYSVIAILLIVFTVAVCAFAILDIKRKRSAVALLVCMLAAIFTTAVCCSVYAKNDRSFDYTLSDTKEWIVMQDAGSVTVLDLSTPSSATASLEIEDLQDRGVTEIDTYVFTSYSSKTASALNKLLGALLIERIYFPTPETEEELAIAEAIISENNNSKSALCFYKSEEFIECGEFYVYPAYRSSDKSKLALTVLYRDGFYTYLSSGMLENDTKNVALPLIDGCNTLILGRHGNSYSDYMFIYQVENLERLVVSSKNLTLPSETVRYCKDQDTDLKYAPERLELYVE